MQTLHNWRFRRIGLIFLVSSVSTIVWFSVFQSSSWTANPALPSTMTVDNNQTVLLFAYMRGGSSFTGRLLTRQDNVFYWYEFFWDVYNAMLSSSHYGTVPIRVAFDEDFKSLRTISVYERDFIRKQTRLLFNCELDKLPVEITTSWTKKKGPDKYGTYRTCLRSQEAYNKFEDFCHKPLSDRCSGHVVKDLRNQCHVFMEKTRRAAMGVRVEEVKGFPTIDSYLSCSAPSRKAANICLPQLIQQCKERPNRMSKILRGNMAAMRDILVDFPNLKIIHLLRDPRGILNSRQEHWGEPIVDFDFEREARLLCTKMREDIRQRQELERLFPGATMEITYENLAQNAAESQTALYRFTGISLREKTKTWMSQETCNSYNVAMGWKERISSRAKDIIDAQCVGLYEVTPYEIIPK